MAFELRRDDGLSISDDRARLDVDRIRGWLAESYWASDRSADAIDRSILNSHTYGVYTPDSEQIALTRVTTDLASFAWLGDVVVDEAWRGRGIGRWLVGAVVEHLREQGVPRFVLATRDAHGVYAGLGFGPLRVPQTWMEIDLRATRPNPGDVTLRP
ncbi:MAG: GNAT family N-acetyltransferase [Pseudonocardiales bacterium]|nr:MAG: GNAT family N-acetyltransferase [Pseudonocardiales bacterium]